MTSDVLCEWVWMWVTLSVSITCYRCFSVCLLALDISFSSASYCVPDCYKIAHPQASGTTWWRYNIHWFHIYHLLRLGRSVCRLCNIPCPRQGFWLPVSRSRSAMCSCNLGWDKLWIQLCEICVEPWQGPLLERPERMVRATAELRPFVLAGAMLCTCLNIFLPPGAWPSDWNS